MKGGFLCLEMDPFEVCCSLGHQLEPMNIALPFFAIFWFVTDVQISNVP